MVKRCQTVSMHEVNVYKKNSNYFSDLLRLSHTSQFGKYLNTYEYEGITLQNILIVY